MGAAFTLLFSKISAVTSWIGSLWVAIFVAAYDMARDAISWCFDQALQVATSAVSTIDVSGLNGYASQAGTLPADLLNVLALLGVGTAISIITVAIGIRLVLQLIPFVRLGS